jgi:hypothetical protein
MGKDSGCEERSATAQIVRVVSRQPPGERLDDHRGSVVEHLRDARHDLGRVVAHADDGVGAAALSVRQQDVERVGAGTLAQGREDRDVPAEEGLHLGPDGAEEGAGAHRHAAHQAERLHHSIAR